MKMADLTPGTVAYKGTADQRRNGEGAEKVIVLAVGNYTETWATGCPGRAVEAVKYGDGKRIVVARAVRHGWQEPVVKIWRPEVTRAGQLMSAPEYETRHKATLRVKKAQKKHADAGDKILKDIQKLLAPHLSKIVPGVKFTVHNRSHWRGENPNRMDVILSDIDVSQPGVQTKLPVKVKKELNELITAHAAWREIKDPGSC